MMVASSRLPVSRKGKPMAMAAHDSAGAGKGLRARGGGGTGEGLGACSCMGPLDHGRFCAAVALGGTRPHDGSA